MTSQESWRAAMDGLLQKMRPNAVALIDRCGPPIAADEFGIVRGSRRGHERVIGGTAADDSIGQRRQKVPVRGNAQTQERLGKPRLQEFEDEVASRSMRGRQPGQHGIRLEGAMLDQTNVAFEGTPRRFVSLVPGRKRSNDETGVDGRQRRTRSRVSRTSAAVSVGSRASGTATRPFPRFLSRIGVGAISISNRPSPARISSACPGFSPSACRSALGTTRRPAASKVTFMEANMP